METKDLETILSKKYFELTEETKKEFTDLFQSEDEFNQLKYTFFQINEEINSFRNNESEPSSKIKENLDNLFHKTYQNKSVLWYNSVGIFFINQEKKWYNQNLTKIAAILLVSFLVVPFVYNNKMIDKTILTAKNEIKEEKINKKNDLKEEFANPIQDNDIEINSLKKDKQNAQNQNESTIETPGINDITTIKLDRENSFSAAVTGSAFEDFTLSPTVVHPDGIYMAKDSEAQVKSSFSLKSNLDYLDLLTPTY